jgi:hypothetical protein
MVVGLNMPADDAQDRCSLERRKIARLPAVGHGTGRQPCEETVCHPGPTLPRPPGGRAPTPDSFEPI